jgi:hypothetical protein
MANRLYYSNLNPIKFYLPSPDRTYESRDIDDFEFFDSIPEWEEQLDYLQPWNNTDTFPIHFMADFGPHNILVKDLDGILITTIAVPAISTSQDDPTLKIFQANVSCSLIGNGEYRFYLESGITDKLILQSNRQDICTRHKHSLLLEYFHYQYHEGVVFETGVKFRFRVEGSNKYKTPASIGEDFEDQTLDDLTLDAKAYRIYELIIGDSYGVPPYVIDIVNLIFTCSDVKIDGKGFKKPIDNKWEPNEQDGYPLKGWKTELRQSVNRNTRIYDNNDPQNSKVSIAINADSKGFGKDTGGTNNIVIDVQ